MPPASIKCLEVSLANKYLPSILEFKTCSTSVKPTAIRFSKSELILGKEDVYGQFYGHVVVDEEVNKKLLKIQKEDKQFRTKMIHKSI